MQRPKCQVYMQDKEQALYKPPLPE